MLSSDRMMRLYFVRTDSCLSAQKLRSEKNHSLLYSTTVHLSYVIWSNYCPPTWTDFAEWYFLCNFLTCTLRALLFWTVIHRSLIFPYLHLVHPVVSFCECLLEIWRRERQAVPQHPVTNQQPRTRNNPEERRPQTPRQKTEISLTCGLHMSDLPLARFLRALLGPRPVKVKFTLEQATKAQRVRGGIALLFPYTLQ